MATNHPFQGKVLDSTQLMLGEGPSFDPISKRIGWLNIIGKELHELDPASGEKTVTSLPFMASVVAAIDAERQLLGTEDGLFIRNRSTGELSLHVDFEPNKPGNRSNDGRVHQSGALWIGTNNHLRRMVRVVYRKEPTRAHYQAEYSDWRLTDLAES